MMLTLVSRGNLWFTKWVGKTGLKASETCHRQNQFTTLFLANLTN